MKIKGLHRLEKFKHQHASARAACNNWLDVTETAIWRKFDDVRNAFNRVDRHKDRYIFDLANHYRLIASIDFTKGQVSIRDILHHDEYMRGTWNK